MTLMPIDWDNRPEKRCLAPCPENVPCECRERAAYYQKRAAWYRMKDHYHFNTGGAGVKEEGPAVQAPGEAEPGDGESAVPAVRRGE